MIPAALVLPAITATGAAAYLLVRRSLPAEVERAIEESPEIKLSIMGQPSAVRKQNAQIIAREFLAAGYSPSMALAAIVNSVAESRLNHQIQSEYVDPRTGQREDSVGLFQLNSQGAGAGMGESRKDPVLNTRRIIKEVRNRWQSTEGGVESLAAADARGAGFDRLAGLFAYHVERPKERVAAIEVRAALARSVFPTVSGAGPGGGLPWGWIIGGTTLLALGGASWWLYGRRRR